MTTLKTTNFYDYIIFEDKLTSAAGAISLSLSLCLSLPSISLSLSIYLPESNSQLPKGQLIFLLDINFYMFIDKQWTAWSSWAACTACSPTQSRNRSCIPSIDFGGRDCPVLDLAVEELRCFPTCYSKDVSHLVFFKLRFMVHSSIYASLVENEYKTNNIIERTVHN
jgi:hypothetical protein